mgnify:CR=1 FL=1
MTLRFGRSGLPFLRQPATRRFGAYRGGTRTHKVGAACPRARARLRGHGLPALVEDLGDGVVFGLARSAALLREDSAALDLWAEQALTSDVAELAALPRAVRLRVLRRLALGAGCRALSREHVLAMAGLIEDWRGQGPIDLPGGVRAASWSACSPAHAIRPKSRRWSCGMQRRGRLPPPRAIARHSSHGSIGSGKRQ